MSTPTSLGITDAHACASRTVRPTGRVAQALETGRVRLLITGVVFCFCFLAVAVRLVDVTVLKAGSEPRLARVATVAPSDRTDIVDRNGVVLATSLPTASLYADPVMVLDPDEAADQLCAVLPELDHARVLAMLDSERRFVWLKRNLTPRQQYEVNRLGIPGLAFQTEERRFYPAGALTAHILGFTDVDGHGLAGIERSLESRLVGASEPLALSIDLRMQEMMREELQEAVEEFRAIGGAGLIMNANTGEILAMVSLPDFHPYEAGSVPEETRFNRTTLGIYEMGSTFKVFTTAMALDSGATTLAGGYDATHPIHVGRFTISDFHAQRRWLTVPEIFMHSSNIGAVHMALAVGTAGQQEYMRRFGLTRPATVELPEIGAPMIPHPWREINTMTIAFGHGMAVSPVQLVTAVAAVVNGGVLHPATLLRRAPGEPVPGTQVISPRTSDAMRRLFRLVVEQGTGRSADADGYLVGGKTGTAEKTRGRHYAQHALLSSFVGAFPINRPQYVVFAMLDEPKGNTRTYGYATGGWVAAPVVGRVVERMGPMVGIRPVDPQAPEIREAVAIQSMPGRGSQLAALQADR